MSQWGYTERERQREDLGEKDDKYTSSFFFFSLLAFKHLEKDKLVKVVLVESHIQQKYTCCQ